MFKKWFVHKSSIQNKFLLSTLVLIIIPLGVFGMVSFQVSKNSIESQVNQSNLKTLGQISEKTDMLLDDIISVSNTFYLNAQVSHGFTAEFAPNSYEEAVLRSTFNELLTNSIYSFGSLKYNVTLLGLNGLKLSTNPQFVNASLAEIVEEEWYKQASEARGRILWITEPIPGLEPAGAGNNSFYAVRVSNRFENGAPTGIVIISVEEETLAALYAGSLDEKQEIVVVDGKGTVLSAKHQDLQQALLQERPYYGKISQYDSGYFIGRELDEEQLISFQTVEKTGWKLVSYTPTRSVLASINRVQTIVLIVFAIVVLLSFAASYVMARRLAVPIKRLYRDFGRVEEGDLSVSSPVESEDEIGLLTGKFNRMVQRLHELLEDVKREQQQKRRAELTALQSQINPHFLYNTLASIRFMLYKHNPETVDSVIVALVRLLKQTLSKEDELIPLEEELQILRNYLHIQQVRQGNKLELAYEIDDAILDYKTIKLILQPLVENAVFHGLEASSRTGRIAVRGYLESGDVVLEVEDNGVGMELEADGKHIRGIMDADGDPLSHGGGCRNVHERLQLHFGAGYGLTLLSQPGEGTLARIRIPALYK